MKSNAYRMQAAVAFVAEHPGSTAAAVTAHLLGGAEHIKAGSYKQAASVVDRIVRDRLVRQDSALRLLPWNPKEKAYADALERAAFLAPDDSRFTMMITIAIDAWRRAGDDNRARILERLDAERRGAGMVASEKREAR